MSVVLLRDLMECSHLDGRSGRENKALPFLRERESSNGDASGSHKNRAKLFPGPLSSSYVTASLTLAFGLGHRGFARPRHRKHFIASIFPDYLQSCWEDKFMTWLVGHTCSGRLNCVVDIPRKLEKIFEEEKTLHLDDESLYSRRELLGYWCKFREDPLHMSRNRVPIVLTTACIEICPNAKFLGLFNVNIACWKPSVDEIQRARNAMFSSTVSHRSVINEVYTHGCSACSICMWDLCRKTHVMY